MTLVVAEWTAGNAKARELYRRAVALLKTSGDAYTRAEAALRFARTVLVDRPKERQRALTEALALAQRIGAKHLAVEIGAALRPPKARA